jgi:hypothetical protein
MYKLWTTALVTAVTLFGAGAALAGTSDPNDPTKMCVADAVTTKNACQMECRDAFFASVDACRNVNHDCANTARDTRESCVNGVLAALKQCEDDSCAPFVTQIAQCKADNPPGQQRDICINGAQLLNFQCRDQCRENVKLFASLKQCRDEFRVDLAACKNPMPDPNDPNAP